MQMSACFTGHRPKRFHFGYDESHEDCLKLKMKLREWIEFLVANNVTMFYSGLALGVDSWAASIVLDLKKIHPNICLHAAVPFKAQASSWSSEQQKNYQAILTQCDHVTTMSEKYSLASIFTRNRFMVDNSNYLLAVYDGDKKGGTAYTVKYSQSKKKESIIIHPDSLEVTTTLS